MFIPPIPPAVDPRMAMIHALAMHQPQVQAQPHPIHPAMARAQAIGSLHQVAAALAANLVRQRSPLGTAQVSRHAQPLPPPAPSVDAGQGAVDGGYNWGRRAFAPPSMSPYNYLPGMIPYGGQAGVA